jgi:hypothetical protein
MARAINPGARIPYILREEQKAKPEDQTKWIRKNLTVSEYTYLMDPHRASQAIPNALHLGLVEAVNFLDEDGQPVILVRDDAARPLVGDTKPWSEDSLSRIHPHHRDEIAGAIIAHAQLKKEAAKNS